MIAVGILVEMPLQTDSGGLNVGCILGTNAVVLLAGGELLASNGCNSTIHALPHSGA